MKVQAVINDVLLKLSPTIKDYFVRVRCDPRFTTPVLVTGVFSVPPWVTEEVSSFTSQGN